jgi:hypothetical protein
MIAYPAGLKRTRPYQTSVVTSTAMVPRANMKHTNINIPLSRPRNVHDEDEAQGPDVSNVKCQERLARSCSASSQFKYSSLHGYDGASSDRMMWARMDAHGDQICQNWTGTRFLLKVPGMKFMPMVSREQIYKSEAGPDQRH